MTSGDGSLGTLTGSGAGAAGASGSRSSAGTNLVGAGAGCSGALGCCWGAGGSTAGFGGWDGKVLGSLVAGVVGAIPARLLSAAVSSGFNGRPVGAGGCCDRLYSCDGVGAAAVFGTAGGAVSVGIGYFLVGG
jgi:hypothetical protein